MHRLAAVALLTSMAIVAVRTQQIGSSRTALATVFDPRNRPLVDVDADDFVIQEAGQSREILSVHLADYPIVVMIDVGGAAQSDLPLMQRAVTRFLQRVGEQRPIALGSFSDQAHVIAGFEDDRQQLIERLNALAVDGRGVSLTMEATSLAARTAASTGSLFSAAIILSAGASDDRTARADELVTAIVNSGTMVHVIANRATRPFGPTPAQGMLPTLRNLAEQTRGGFTAIYNAASFEAALEQLANRFATEVMVEYLVPNDSRASDVKVGVRIPGAHVRGLGVAPR